MKIKQCLLLCCLLISGAVFAQSEDSVRIRLFSPEGSIVSLDGEQSSTNIMAKYVSYGTHKVTIEYGEDFTKEYEINIVAGSDTDFKFSLDGMLKATSNVSDAVIAVDGIEYGKMPQDIPLLGNHNVHIYGGELYEDKIEQISLQPYEELSRHYQLAKLPLKLYGFFIVNYIPSANSVGIMGGIGRRFGVYAKLNIDIVGDDMYATDHLGKRLPRGEYDDHCQYQGYNIGATWRAKKWLTLYLGGGYGKYCHGKCDFFYRDNEYLFELENATFDLGAILKWKALLFQVGYTGILGSSDEGYKFGALNIGLGISIHKNKKK